jgi:multiple sugar transport system permease protein
MTPSLTERIPHGASSRVNWRTTGLWLLLAAIVAAFAFPFLYLILTSFKTPGAAIAVPPTIFPDTWSIENYRQALDTPGVRSSFLHSLSAAVMSTVLSLLLAVPAAYGATRFAGSAGRSVLLAVLVTRIVPPVAIGVPMVSLMRDLQLSDSTLGLALAHTTISLPLSIWLMASFFEAVPRELEEAARVDGSGRLRALGQIVLPLVSGGIAVTGIFGFLASWNEFLFALLLTASRAQTTPIVIANFQTQYGLQWGSMTALATVYSIPVVLLTLGLQRRIVAGMTLGAVKG